MNTKTPRPAIIEGEITKIPLGVGAKDGYAIIDSEYAFLSKLKWHFDGRYAATRFLPQNKKIRLHQMIQPRYSNLVVDHINRNSLDNRRENLRLCTRAENQRNMKPVDEAKRVYWSKRGWFIFLPAHVLGRNIWKGYFKSEAEAKRVFMDLLS